MVEMNYREAAQAVQNMKHFFRALGSLEQVLALAAEAEAAVGAAGEKKQVLDAGIEKAQAELDRVKKNVESLEVRYGEIRGKIDNDTADRKAQLVEAQKEFDETVREYAQQAEEQRKALAVETETARSALQSGLDELVGRAEAAEKRRDQAVAELEKVRDTMRRFMGGDRSGDQ